MTKRRLLVVGTIALLVAECLLFVYLVTVGWVLRDFMLPPGTPEIAVRTRTVFANAAWLAVNVIGLGGYVSRKRAFGRAAILVILAFDVLNSLFAAGGFFFLEDDSTTAVQWLLLTLIPIAALLLLLLQRRTLQTPGQ